MCAYILLVIMITICRTVYAAQYIELRFSGLIGTVSHPDMQKIRITGFFFENRLHLQFEFRLLLFTACTCV